MARPLPKTRPNGFSLVEMMVALLFVMILMAGMTQVFKGTISTFTTTSEKLSSSRRNRMALDLVYEDLNNAGMYLTDLTIAPSYSSTNEGFYIRPDPMANATPATPIPGVTQGADELYFCMDEALPFEGALTTAGTPPKSAAELVNLGTAATTADFTFTLECKDVPYAKQVAVGQSLIFKDSWEAVYITSLTRSGSTVTVVTGADPSVATTGSGASGLPSKTPHISGSAAVFVRGRQQVRYSVQALNLDPASPSAATPCLVRDQGPYVAGAFNPTLDQQIVAENVSGFRVYISADSGKTWVGGAGYADWAAIKKGLDDQLAASGRPDFTSTGTDLNWFRNIPVLVRVDVTTRTATQRGEYHPDGTQKAYKEQTQSVVMVPRHFGLSMN